MNSTVPLPYLSPQQPYLKFPLRYIFYHHSFSASPIAKSRFLLLRGFLPLLCNSFTDRRMGSLATAEACDTNAPLIANGDVRVLPPIFKSYGQARAFSGPIATVKVFEDNVLVRGLLETKGEGRVLMIDGGGSMRCALVGGNLAQLAQNNGWTGIIVNGCIRDVDEINACDIGVRALASHPLKSNKKGHGEKHGRINIAGTVIADGEWAYADSDGVLISRTELSV